MQDIKWGSPIGIASIGVFLGGIGIFLFAIWSTFGN